MTPEREGNLLFELGRCVNNSATNFTCKLFELIMKADTLNKELLRRGFPDEVGVYEKYMAGNYDV